MKDKQGRRIGVINIVEGSLGASERGHERLYGHEMEVDTRRKCDRRWWRKGGSACEGAVADDDDAG